MISGQVRRVGRENESHIIRLKNALAYRKRFMSNRPNDELSLLSFEKRNINYVVKKNRRCSFHKSQKNSEMKQREILLSKFHVY